MAGPVYDDQKQPSAAKPQAEGDAGLAKAEEAASQLLTDGQGLKPDDLEQAEQGGLYNPAAMGDFERAPLWTRIKNINRRKKAAAALGAGGIVSIIIALFTLGPIYRIPSLMSGILGKTGQKVQDIVEDRAQRQIVTYLLWRAGATPSDYVITDSILDSLYATFRTNRLEDRILRETGFKFESAGGRRVRVIHDGRDIGHVRNYDELVELSYKDELTKADIKKIVKTVVPAWRLHLSSKYAKWIKIRYRVPSYAVRPYDKSKTREQNLQALRRDMTDVVDKETLGKLSDGFDCLFEQKCDGVNIDNERVDTPAGQTEQSKHLEDTGTLEPFKEDLLQAAEEAKSEVTQSGGSLTDKIIEKFSAKIVDGVVATSLRSAMPFIGPIDLAATVIVMEDAVIQNRLTDRLPAIIAEQATGAMYADWQGKSSAIMAGKMDMAFVNELNKQVAGAEKAAAYGYTFEGVAEGEPMEVRINNDVQNPRNELVRTTWLVWPGTFMRFVAYAWYETIGKIIGVLGDFTGAILGFLFELLQINEALEALMVRFFGENWKTEFAKFCLKHLINFMGVAIDPLATGARWFNQVYAGGDAAMNTYCRLNLGCRALTGLKSKNFFGAGDQRLDMAVLPLKDRLFSVEQPKSLASEFWRSVPAGGGAGSWLTAAFGQVAKVPGSLLAAFSGRSLAAVATTAEQDASIAGVRQYGMTIEERNRDIAPEIRQAGGLEGGGCPEVDPEEGANLCKADMEVAQSLMCWSLACPEYGGN